ncbi:hypothetical protein NL108_015112, partial [Boleophthalmus pectinirostris]
WYPLESKPGAKKKERGRIQVSIQFMRNNMTASMFDLSMKEKPRSPFFKLKNKVKGRKHDSGFSDTSSAILPRSALDSEPRAPVGPPSAPAAGGRSEPKVKRPLLAGGQKLSAAHSMSDLIGNNFRPKLDSMNSIEETGGGEIRLCFALLFYITKPSSSGPHRRTQSEVPDFQDREGQVDPFTHITDALPQKYATLPRKGNPFEGEGGGPQLWDRPSKEKKEKVSLLERVTGKKEGKKTSSSSSNGGKLGSTGDLRTPNPFTNNGQQADTNPFSSNFKPRCC